MSAKTEHYGLHQWAPEDDFLRTDFNEDLAKIDAALGGKANIIMGTYTGNGAAEQEIALEVKPKLLFIWEAARHQLHSAQGAYCGFASADFHTSFQGHPVVELSDTGFTVYLTYFTYNGGGCEVGTNKSNTTYCYIALL